MNIEISPYAYPTPRPHETQPVPEEENQEKNQLSPEKVMEYVAQLGESLVDYAKVARTLIIEANEEGTVLDLGAANWALTEFSPGGEFEKQLVHMNARLLDVHIALREAGIKADYLEVKRKALQS